MANHSLIPTIVKKALGPFRNLEKFFSHESEAPKIFFTEENALLPEPHIDVSENDKEFHITAYVPGLEKNDIHIELHKGALSLRGAKRVEKEETCSNCHIIEHASVYFNHTVQLPKEIDENDIEATLKDGIIDIALAKLTKDHPTGNPNKINTVRT